MNEIELWESEISEANRYHVFGDLDNKINLLTESIVLDSKILRCDAIDESAKDFLVNIGEKIGKLIQNFIEFISNLAKKVKSAFNNGASDVAQIKRTNRAKEIKDGHISSEAHTKVREYFENNSKYGGLLMVRVDSINKELQKAEKEFKDLDTIAKDISSGLNTGEIESLIDNLKADLELSKNPDKYFEEKFNEYFHVVDLNSFGNTIQDVAKNINKLDSNLDKGIDAFEKYCDVLVKLSKGYNVQAVSKNFKNAVEGDKEKGKLIGEYFASLSAYYHNQKIILTNIIKILFTQKKEADHVFKMYLSSVSDK